jgi:Fe-S-cluster containining protein
MPKSYFQYQVHLSETDPGFFCREDCDAPGCWMKDVVVEVTLVDLIRLSFALNFPVSDLFSQYCSIGLKNLELNPRYNRLLVKLKKPCPFLREKRCGVHGSKPLSCVLFPEYHQIKGLLPELAMRPVFGSFPCFREEIVVSENRSNALRKLKTMGNREEALSSYFLFDAPSFIIDAKPLTRQLKKASPKKKIFFMQDYERLVHEKLKPTGLFDSIEKKISTLDSLPGITRLFNQLEDDSLMNPLVEKMIKPEVVLKIAGEKVKHLRRDIQSPGVIFM